MAKLASVSKRRGGRSQTSGSSTKKNKSTNTNPAAKTSPRKPEMDVTRADDDDKVVILESSSSASDELSSSSTLVPCTILGQVEKSQSLGAKQEEEKLVILPTDSFYWEKAQKRETDELLGSNEWLDKEAMQLSYVLEDGVSDWSSGKNVSTLEEKRENEKTTSVLNSTGARESSSTAADQSGEWHTCSSSAMNNNSGFNDEEIWLDWNWEKYVESHNNNNPNTKIWDEYLSDQEGERVFSLWETDNFE